MYAVQTYVITIHDSATGHITLTGIYLKFPSFTTHFIFPPPSANSRFCCFSWRNDPYLHS